jgi:hypothetical protein
MLQRGQKEKNRQSSGQKTDVAEKKKLRIDTYALYTILAEGGIAK